MRQSFSSIPLSYAVESFSLGMDLQDNNVDRVSCGVPCIYRNGVLIPTMQGIPGRYPRYRFSIAVDSYDETGGGVFSLVPEPLDNGEIPLVDLPIYEPPEGDSQQDCDRIETMLGERLGYSALLTSFTVATELDMNSRERYTGVAGMRGAHEDSSSAELPYEPEATVFYVGLLRDVGVSKLRAILAQRQKLDAATAKSALNS